MAKMKNVTVRGYNIDDVPAMAEIWNEVVKEGNAFPQKETLDYEGAKKFFASQTFCGVAEYEGETVGMYILHPNNVGRCGHIANASYAVKNTCRGKGAGKVIVEHCLFIAKQKGFKVLQFNVNHPMAGKTLNFEVEVVSVRDVTPEDLQGHCSCGSCGDGCDDGCCEDHGHGHCNCH